MKPLRATTRRWRFNRPYVGALENRATTLYQANRFEEAARDYDRVLSLEPSRRYILGYSLLAKLQSCDWSSLQRDKARVEAGLPAGKRIIHPFANLALSSSPEDQLAAAKIRTADRYPQSSPPPTRKPNARGKIRIAYVSADFCAHATAYLMAGVFEQHDKTRFELVALAACPKPPGLSFVRHFPLHPQSRSGLHDDARAPLPRRAAGAFRRGLSDWT